MLPSGALLNPRALSRLGAAVALVALVLAAGCQKPSRDWFGSEVLDPQPAPPLIGTNWDGEPFALSELQGKVAVIFFGYTYCPDVCPFTLAKMKQIYSKIGDEAAEDLEVVFVSVDPHRDKIEKLAQYVPNFDERFYGLRLEFGELEDVQEDWDVTVQYSQPKDGPGTDSYYYVDHTGTFFVVDRQGRLRLTFPPNARAEQMLPDLEALLEE